MAKSKNNTINFESGEDFFNSSIVSKIQKDFGTDVCVPLSKINDVERGIIKTFPSLDLVLGGGILRGTLVQLAGKPKVGKSTLSFNIASRFQEQFSENYVIYYKCEGRMSKSVLDGIKELNQDKFIIIKSTADRILSAQDFLAIQEQLMREFPGSLHIVDSISGLSSDTEMSDGINDEQYCGISKLLAKWCRRNASVYGITNSTIIALNHIRDSVRSMSGGSYTTGGKHWHHQIDTNIWLSDSYQEGKIDNSNGETIGKNVDIDIKTTVMAKPNTKTVLSLIYGEGFSELWDIFNLGLQLGVISQAGAWYSYGEERIGQGKLNVISTLSENKEIKNSIYSKIMEMLGH